MNDITLAVTAHNEGLMAGPCMKSAEAAVAHARMAGYSVETIVGLDTPTEDTKSFFGQPHFQNWYSFEFNFGDQGLTRNAMARAGTGQFLGFLDADDLISENWLTRCLECLQQAEAESLEVIVHPELNWQFDGIQNVYAVPQQDDPFFSPHVMATANYYDAICTAPRRAWLDHGFPHRDIENGFALEDYQWFVEMTARGWFHAVARDTIVFKRRRDNSQSDTARTHRAVIRAIAPLLTDRIHKMAVRDPGR
ncbi:MAG: glycosyltransferase [Rhodobacteraceae bacterium]|nr:glycosyltransferase [Paracoccaceae bacterium]